MKDSMIIQGFEYISSSRAAEITKYSNDYIGQLCRKGKVSARMIGRTWFVDKQSLLKHQEEADISKHLNGKNLVLSGGISNAIKSAPAPSAKSTVSTAVSNPSAKLSELPAIGTYAADDGPFMPVIDKQPAVPVPPISPATVQEDPIHSAMRIGLPIDAPVVAGSSQKMRADASAFLTRRTVFAAIAAVMLVAVASGSVALFDSNPSLARNNDPLASAYDAVEAVGAFLHNAYVATLALFGHGSALTLNVPSSTPAVGAPSSAPSENPSLGQGMAVLPSSGSSDVDAAAKQQVQDSFSDQVNVSADKSGTAGVITPVFKDTAGKNFMYVLVPVKKASGQAQSAP